MKSAKLRTTALPTNDDVAGLGLPAALRNVLPVPVSLSFVASFVFVALWFVGVKGSLVSHSSMSSGSMFCGWCCTLSSIAIPFVAPAVSSFCIWRSPVGVAGEPSFAC